MTTVVITHDLSQITAQDFIYVLQQGRVIEQGYRYDLERTQGGEFRTMMQIQRATGGFLPVKDLGPGLDWAEVQREHTPVDDNDEGEVDSAALARRSLHNLRTFSIVAGRTPPHRIRRVPRFDDLAGAFGQSETSAIHRSALEASRRRRSSQGAHRKHRAAQIPGELDYVKVDTPRAYSLHQMDQPPSFWRLIRDVYPTVPSKSFVLFGLLVCVLSGAMTPLFSFLLSRLLFEVSIGALDTTVINKFGAIVLSVAAGDGFLMGLKYFLMETAAMHWVNFIRELCFNLILTQDKKWFDKPQNSPVRMVQILVKDGDDARVLMAEVLGQCVVVVAMLCAGLTWALIRGWQLTLVGVAIAPVFAAIMAFQNTLVARFEYRRKRAKEEVAKVYYEVSRTPRCSFRRDFYSNDALGDLEHSRDPRHVFRACL
jgi:ATP-binding cassette subfamily B (MDR/TAP) protein 1